MVAEYYEPCPRIDIHIDQVGDGSDHRPTHTLLIQQTNQNPDGSTTRDLILIEDVKEVERLRDICTLYLELQAANTADKE